MIEFTLWIWCFEYGWKMSGFHKTWKQAERKWEELKPMGWSDFRIVRAWTAQPPGELDEVEEKEN